MQQALSPDELAAYEAKRKGQMRPRFLLCGSLSFVGYLFYGILDYATAHGSLLRFVLQVRFLFLLMLGILTWMSQTNVVRRFPYGFSQFMCVYTCMGAVVITIVVGPQVYAYHLGMLLVLVGWTALMPWRVVDAIVSYCLVLVGYILLEIRFNGPSLSSFVTAVSYAIAIVVSVISVVITDNLAKKNFVLSRRVEASYSALQKVDEAKNTFFANISHELRTPIMLVLASLESVISERGISGADGHQLGVMNRSATRLLRMVDDLLELTRLQSSSVVLNLTRWNMDTLLQQQVEQAAPIANKKEIAMNYAGGAASISVTADCNGIERVVENLLTNAIKFTPPGGRIEVSLALRDGAAEVAVKDSGPGIPEAELERVFERFYQGQSGKKAIRGGVGIGLSMCKTVIDLHGGNIRIDSTIGQGTTVVFTLPAAVPGRAEAVSDLPVNETGRTSLIEWDKRLRKDPSYRLSALNDASERRLVPRDQDKQAALSVLIVDDDRDLIELISGMISADYNVYVASDGEEGLSRARQKLPDIIISDVAMPKMDGFAMLVAIREDTRLKDTPVIMMTARGIAEDRKNAGHLEADDFLPKPFTAADLHPLLKRHLRRQQSNIDQMQKASQLAVNIVVSGLAHDVMNPISFLRTATALAEKNNKIITARAEDAGIDISESRAVCEKSFAIMNSGLQRIVDAMEQLKKAAKGQDIGEPIVTELTPLVQRTMVMVAATSRIKSELQSRAKIRIKAGQLERVLLNLLLNAIQAGGEGCSIMVTTADDLPNKLAIIEVTDTGPGMDALTMQRIFEPNFTTKASGSGLGLAVCRDIVKSAGGHLDVDSQQGRGTTFKIALPAVS